MVNYDPIAPFYDVLAQIVFGQSQREAEEYFCKEIYSGSRLLIVGGGTGAVLETLARTNSQNVEVIFVEKSASMMALAKKRNTGSLRVEFVQNAVEVYKTDKLFDWIITSFFFDNFPNDYTDCVIKRLSKFLKKEGKWIVTDFRRPEKWLWKMVFWYLETTMYLFFRFISNVKVNRLPSFRQAFQKNDLQLITQKGFYKGMISTELYQLR